jgi:cell division topological specificity factor
MAENIFAEIYNKILGLFGQSTQKEDSKDVAVNRLRLVLMQDRTNLTPEIMQRMRKELIELLSKYVELDKEALELNFEQEGEQMALMLSIPVLRAKDEAEIEAALQESEEAQEDEQDSDSEDENSDEESSEEENAEGEENQDDSQDENNEHQEENSEESQEQNDNPEEQNEQAPESENVEEPKKRGRKKSEEQ